jgi:hypothetical protein
LGVYVAGMYNLTVHALIAYSYFRSWEEPFKNKKAYLRKTSKYLTTRNKRDKPTTKSKKEK